MTGELESDWCEYTLYLGAGFFCPERFFFPDFKAGRLSGAPTLPPAVKGEEEFEKLIGADLSERLWTAREG